MTARQLLRVLHGLGFPLGRQSGSSHGVYRRDADGRRTIVPIHPGTIIKRKTLGAVLDDIGLSVESFRDLL